MSRSAYVFEEQRRVFAYEDSEVFDRVAYAMRALAVLRPRGLRVAVRTTGHRTFRIDGGRAWDRGPEARWATIAIPQTASRAEIAVTLAELAGLEKNSLAVALLMAGADRPTDDAAAA